MVTLTIGRLADDLGISIDTIRYYERRGLLPDPPRTSAGYRTYGDSDRWRLRFVLRAKDLGFTLREIAGLLAEVTDTSGDAATAVRAAAAAKLTAVEAQQAELADLGARLAALVGVCDDGDDDGCTSLGTTTCAP